jgi:tartrate-resistant acid phosphatase type 5
MSQSHPVDLLALNKMGISIVLISLVLILLSLLLAACQPAGLFPISSSTSQPSDLHLGTIPVSQTALFSQTYTPVIAATTQTHSPVPPSPTATFTPMPTVTSVPPLIFAAIGDYGTGDEGEADVAAQVLSWNPEFIITLGDDNYPVGAAEHIDEANGQFFHFFIYPYKGSYGAGADFNRFFPTLGNHDVMTDNGQPYFDYFTLPGNQRYYDFTWGPVHLYALDNIETEPDGVGASSIQANWLETSLAASTSVWNIVYMHYPPYSSGLHGSTDWARWPYKEWGADAVLAGHDHTYERLDVDGLPYFVNGLGGGGIYYFTDVLDGSQVRYNGDYGAMRIEAAEGYIKFEFITRSGEVIDSYLITG